MQRNLRDMEAEGRMHLTDYQTALAELETIVGTMEAGQLPLADALAALAAAAASCNVAAGRG